MNYRYKLKNKEQLLQLMKEFPKSFCTWRIKDLERVFQDEQSRYITLGFFEKRIIYNAEKNKKIINCFNKFKKILRDNGCV